MASLYTENFGNVVERGVGAVLKRVREVISRNIASKKVEFKDDKFFAFFTNILDCQKDIR